MLAVLGLAATSSLRWGTAGVGSLLLLTGLLVATLVVAVLAYRHTQPSLLPGQRMALTALRASVFLVIVVMLAQPIVHDQRNVEVPPGLLVLVDDSASMGIVGESGKSRIAEAREGQERTAESLRSRNGDTRVWAGQGARRLRTTVSADQFAVPGRETLSEGTDLPGLLISAAQRHLEDNLQGIVLFSDGVSTTREQPSLAGLGVPVFPVAVGDSIGPADLRLDHVRYPTLVYRGEQVRVDAEVVANTARAGSSWVVLETRGVPADSVEIRWPDGGGRVPVAFDIVADSLGLQVHQIVARPLPAEPLVQNNRVMAGFEVRKDRLRVVYVEARPSWNFHFLRRVAATDRRFEFLGVYRGPEGWKIAGADSTWSVPQGPADTRDVDLWIAGSIPDLNSLVSGGSAISDAVRAGAGLLLVTGEPRRGMVPAMSSLASELAPLAPQPADRWRLARHAVRATAVGRGHPVLAFQPQAGDVGAALASLPPLWGVLGSAEARDDADILITAEREGRTNPLLLIRQHGSGGVAAWTGGPLWSWSFWRLGTAESEDTYRALMGNLLYYLAEGGDRTRLRLLLPQQVLAQGQDALIRGLALDPRMQPDDSHDVWLEWSPGSLAPDSDVEASGRARMELDPGTPGGRLLALPSLPAGEYSVRLALEEGDDRLTSDWTPLVMDPYSVEFQRPQADRAALQRIATATGGRLLAAGDLDAWIRSLSLQPRTTLLTARIDLWSSLWLFLPLLLLLSAEWGLRKRWGLI